MSNLINAEFLMKDTSGMSRREKMQHLRDLEFEKLSFINHWTEEEKKLNRVEFEAEKDRESKLYHNSINVLFGNDSGMTAFEKKQAEKFIERKPEIKDIATGFINMVAEGRNDVENI